MTQFLIDNCPGELAMSLTGFQIHCNDGAIVNYDVFSVMEINITDPQGEPGSYRLQDGTLEIFRDGELVKAQFSIDGFSLVCTNAFGLDCFGALPAFQFSIRFTQLFPCSGISGWNAKYCTAPTTSCFVGETWTNFQANPNGICNDPPFGNCVFNSGVLAIE